MLRLLKANFKQPCITYEQNYFVPSQLWPFFTNPFLHWQLYDPSVFLHSELAIVLHGLPCAHSSISDKREYDMNELLPMFTIAHSTKLPLFAIVFLSMVLLLHVCFIRSKIAVSLLTFYKYHIDFLKSCKFKIQKSSIFIVPTCVNKKYNSSLF